MKRILGSLVMVGLAVGPLIVHPPSPSHSQGVDVYLNVTQGGSRKFGLAIPEFARVTDRADWNAVARVLPDIIGNDLRFSTLFAVANTAPLPPDADARRNTFAELAGAGAHAVVDGRLGIAGARVTVEFRLYDLTHSEYRTIASKVFWVEPLQEHRRLAHRIADEIVYQFTGEHGIAETKIAYVRRSGPYKEIAMMDYDGANPFVLTDLRSVSLSPVWNPVDLTLAFTSFYRGAPHLFRLNPFDPARREPALMSARPGINSAPAWSPDGKTVALTLSKDGNAEIYMLRLETTEFRRLTTHRAIDTDATWSPTAREMAFSSDRTGTPQLWVMEVEGGSPRRLTYGKESDTQPRWSPRGDTIVFTRHTATGLDLWAIGPDGQHERPLTRGEGRNESASWAPNGRHLAFSSTRNGWRPRLYVMLADGSGQEPLTSGDDETSSPTWSPRLP